MQYVPLGQSGLIVSRVCLGGNAWGAKGRRAWAAFDESESRPFFRRALDLGISFFDTADVYNTGRSEEILGATLMEYAPRDDLVIASKVGLPMADRPNHKGLGRKHVMASLDASLQRLRTDHVDLYIIHRYDPLTPDDELLDTLDDVVRSGKARYVGASSMRAYQFVRLQTLARARGGVRFVSMQNLYNLLYREEEREMNPFCVEAGVGLTPYSPLARGVVSGGRPRSGGGETDRARTDDQAETYRTDEGYAIAEAAQSIAARLGVTPSQVALAWMLGKPGVVAPVIGASRLHYLDEAAGAVDLSLSEEDVAALESPYCTRPVMGY